ncbi:MAG TPA: DUF2285 domain-containing protein [Polaromonas sp.]|uniref:DUF2285 domain-containing protein n=1 Tax=Polaromonas sp. TaxID=1869339 RepID=UPI002D52DF3C|nr:DUF2285 domain-containing protein [Polaromonas sp.]HYW55784.1 DUF2285 domain-containing protein [Polaromonas sp.]
MTDPNLEDLPSTPWGVSAAYLYLLDLDDSALAWEYLRRHPGYRLDWKRRKRVVSFARWGLRYCEDPDLDGRLAHPLWRSSPDGLLQVRAAHARSAVTRRFDLWRISGRKRLALDGSDLSLTTDLSAQRMHLSLSGSLADGTPYAGAVPLTRNLRGNLGTFIAQAQALEGHPPQVDPARAVSRGALLHLRALQALDAAQVGASQRDIAQVLFGLEAVVLRWHEDGELRAQVRHLLRRAEALMNGGYLTLAGVSHPATNHPGDEPVR